MASSPKELKLLLRERGWRSVELAAFMGLSVQHLSFIINDLGRRALYEDVFRGLPERGSVTIERQPRHIRIAKKLIGRHEVYRAGDELIAETSAYGEVDSRWMVVEVVGRGEGVKIYIQPVDGEGEVVITFEQVAQHFASAV